MNYKTLQWLVFSVVFSFVPIGWAYSERALNQQHGWPSLQPNLVHGELLLISVTLALDALGDLFVSRYKGKEVRLLAGAGCLFSILGSSYLFAQIADGKCDPNKSLCISVLLFVLTLLSAGTCKVFVQK